MTKKIILTLVVYLILIPVDFTISSSLYSKGLVNARPSFIPTELPPVLPVKTEPIIQEDTLYSDVRATVYHAEVEQTDSTPLITADNSLIDTTRVNELRWIAVSRDLVNLKTKRYNFTGKLKLGDTVWISYDRKEVVKLAEIKGVDSTYLINKFDQIVGWWVVKDTMGDYYWQPQKTTPKLVSIAKSNKKEYKIKRGIVYKKKYQRNWIDFLQHPKTGMLYHWNKSIIITKRKVVGHKAISING